MPNKNEIQMPAEKVDLLVQGMAILLFNAPDAIKSSISSTPNAKSSFIAKAVSAGFQEALNESKELKINLKGDTKGLTDMTSFLNYLQALGNEKGNNDAQLKAGITKLTDLLNSSKTSFKGLLEAFNNAFEGAKPLEESSLVALDGINKIFEIVKGIQEIKVKSIFGAKVKLKLIRKLLINDVMGIFKSITEAAAEIKLTKKEKGKEVKVTPEFDILIGFIKAIAELGGLKFKDLFASKFYLFYIKHVLISDIIDLFNEFGKIADDPKIRNSIDNTNKLIQALIGMMSFKDFTVKDIISADIKLLWIASIYEDLFEQISSIISNTEISDQIVESTTKNIDNVNEIFNKIPELAQGVTFENLVGLTFKLAFIQTDINSLGMLIKNDLNGLPLLNKRITPKELEKIQNAIVTIGNLGNLLQFDVIIKGIIELSLISNDVNILKNIISNLNNFEKLNVKDLDKIQDVIVKIGNFGNLLDLGAILKGAIGLVLLGKEIKLLKNIITNVNTLKNLNVKKEENIKRIIGLVVSLNEMNSTSITKVLKSILGFALMNKEIKKLKTIISEINNLDKLDKKKADNFKALLDAIKNINEINSTVSKLKELEKFLKTIDTITTIVTHIGTLLQKGNDATVKLLTAEAKGLQTVVNQFNKIKEKDLKSAKDAALSFAVLIGLSAVTLIMGASLIGLVDIGNLITFAVSLGLFVYLMSFVYKRFSKSSKLTMDGVKAFTLLMVASGGIMLAGSMLMGEVDMGSLVLFTVSLAAFMYLLSFPFRRFAKHSGKTMIGVGSFTLLVIAAGGLLIAAGLLFDDLNFVSIIGFAIATAAFLYLLSYPFKKFAGAKGARSMAGALAFAALLVVAGGLLLAGSYLFDMMFHGNNIIEIIKNGAKSILFCIILALYVRFLIWAVTPKRTKIVQAAGSVGTIIALVVIAGGLLLAGSYLFDLLFDPGRSKGSKLAAWLAAKLPGDTEFWQGAVTGFKSLLFNLILFAFIRLLINAVSLKPGKIASTIVTALAVVTLVVVCGGMLLLAASIMDGWEDAVNIAVFVVCTLGLVWGIGMLMEVLGTLPLANLLQGALAVAIIEVLVFGLGIVMNLIVDVANKINMDAMINFLKSSLYVIGEISALVVVLAAIMAIPGAPLVLGVGAVALAAVLGLAYFLGEMMMTLGNTANELAKMDFNSKIGSFFDNIYAVLDGFYEIIYGGKNGKHKALVEFASLNPLKNIKIFTAIKAIKDLSIALSAVANCVKQWIDLKIPIYDGMEQTGWITIDQTGFKDATDNISNAVISLLAGILFVADYDKEHDLGLFENEGLFAGTKIGRMMRGIELLGVGLSSVAEGVKEWIDLKIPVYQGMKQTGWITIAQSDFRKATDNISNAIISLLAGVLFVAEYDKKHELGLFEYDNIFAGTKMGRMMKGIKLLGVGLSSVAEGVKEWIDLKIPVYQGMKQTGWITIGQKEFNDATDHIANAVISLLAGVLLVAEYDKQHELGLFKYEGIFAGTKIGRMMKGIKMLGVSLSSVASGVKDWIDLKIPVYEGMEQKGWITISDKEFEIASKNIAQTIECLLKGVARSAKMMKDYGLIGDEGFSMNFTSIGFIPLVNIKYKKSPIKEALHAIGLLGVALAAVGTGLKFWADVKFPTGFDKDGKPTGYLTIADMQKTVPENIKSVLIALGEAIVDVYKYGEPKGLFKTDKGSPMFVISSSVNLISGALVTVAKAMGAILGGKFQRFDKDGKVIEEIDFSKLLPDLETNRKGDSKFKRRVKTILTSLGEAIGDIYDSTETKYIFNSSYGGGKSIAENISLAVSSLVDALSKTMEMLHKLNELDKDNKLSSEINTTKEKLKNIIRAVLGIFTIFGGSEVLDADGKSITIENKGWFGIDLGTMSVAQWMTEEQPNIESAKEALSTLTTTVTSIFQQAVTLQESYDKNAQILSNFKPKDNIVALLTEFISIMTIDKFKEINKNEKKLQMISNVSSKIETLNGDIQKIYEKSADLQKIWNDYAPLIRTLLSVKKNNQKTGTLVNSNFVAVKNVNDILTLYNDIITLPIINKLFTSFDALSKTGKNIFEECKNIIVSIINVVSDIFTNSRNLEFTLANIPESKFNVNEAIAQLLSRYVGILQSIKSVSAEFDSLSKEFKAYDSLLRLSKNINSMTSGVTNAINSYIENFSSIKLSTDNIQVDPVIQNVENLKRAWISIMKSIEDLNNKLGNNDKEEGFKFTLFSSGSQFDNLEDLVKVVNKLMDVYDRIESIDAETNAFQKIAQGISTLDIVGQKLTGINNLDKNQKIFEKYVKTLNSINLQKLNTLFNFAAALNKLADRFVSLDGLTDALGNKLTSILQNLITEMKRAEDTIKNADKLRQKREALINKSIGEMKNIMNQHLVVDIYNQSVNQSLNENPDTGTPGTNNESEGGAGGGTGGGAAGNTSTPMLNENEKAKGAQNFQRGQVQHTNTISAQIKSAINSSLNTIFNNVRGNEIKLTLDRR